MLENPARSKTRNRLLLTAFVVYLVAVLIYMIYSLATDTGLGGAIMAQQLQVAGTASERLAALVAMLILLLPLVAVAGIAGLIAPAASKDFWAYAAAKNKGGFGSLTWRVVLGVPAVILLVGGSVTGVFFLLHKQQERVPVETVDLAATAPATPDRSQGYISLSGTVAHRFLVTYRSNGPQEVYAPVVEPHWTPKAPVRYLVHYHDDKGEDLPYVFSADVSTEITGKLSHDVPGPIARKLADENLLLPDGVAVVEWGALPGRSSSDYADVIISGVLTGLLLLLSLPLLIRLKVQQDRQARKAQARVPQRV